MDVLNISIINSISIAVAKDAAPVWIRKIRSVTNTSHYIKSYKDSLLRVVASRRGEILWLVLGNHGISKFRAKSSWF